MYVVQPGDTLGRIAAKYGVPVEQIEALNPDDRPAGAPLRRHARAALSEARPRAPGGARGRAASSPRRPERRSRRARVASSWVLVDASDGDVLAARSPHDELPMASTTKLMTALLARQDLQLDDVVTAAPYSPGAAESLMGLRDNESVSVHDLLYGLLLESGNDAAQTLAVASAGSEDAFVKEMNRDRRQAGPRRDLV